MTKEEFWNLKHTELAMRFDVRNKTIKLLRSFAVGQKLTRGQIILWINKQIAKTRRFIPCDKCDGTGKLFFEPNPKIEHQEALDLVARATEQDWKDITFDYKYTEKHE